MSWLALDTNAYRALCDGNTTLVNKVSTTPHIGLPIIVLGELYHGVYNGTKQQHNIDQLKRFLAVERLDILQVDSTTARIFGEVATELRQKGRPIQQNDIWIAALCKQYDYTLATNDAGFQNILGLEIFNF